MPPHLAGREAEIKQFEALLQQSTILSNLVITGLRGVGKTVLLETFKPIAMQGKWLWVGTDLSESTSVSEETVAQRFLTDLAIVTSSVVVTAEVPQMGFLANTNFKGKKLNFATLVEIYNTVPGLASDKLKFVFEFIWFSLRNTPVKGVVFAYDEAQTMSDHAESQQYPLSLVLDVFQSIQKRNIPFMLVLAGLPTLFPKLVEARTFAERMFKVMTLGRLNEQQSREAITKPVEQSDSLPFTENSIVVIIKTSGGYPYFIQFICKEVVDIWLQNLADGKPPSVPVDEITRKLDKDFFAGRWARLTDRQRVLLGLIASLDNCEEEFTVQEIVEEGKRLANPFGASHINQMLTTLIDAGLVYKNRHGKYSFAVPLMSEFILRQEEEHNKMTSD